MTPEQTAFKAFLDFRCGPDGLCTVCLARKVWTDTRCPEAQRLFEVWQAFSARAPAAGIPRGLFQSPESRTHPH